jgi:hypothetical protein
MMYAITVIDLSPTDPRCSLRKGTLVCLEGDSWLLSNDAFPGSGGVLHACHCTTMSHALPCCLDTPGRVYRKHDYRRGLMSRRSIKLRHFQSTCCSRDRLEMLYMPLGLSTLERPHTNHRPPRLKASPTKSLPLTHKLPCSP